MPGRRVEVLTFAGCPSEEAARALVTRVVSDLGLEVEVASVRVEGSGAAERLRFLGSPTIRIDGIDVEPGADERGDCSLACRVYRTRHGAVANVPEEAWVRAALGARPDEGG